MGRKAAFFSLIFLLPLAGCESSTDLDEVTLVGRWNAAGAIQEAEYNGASLEGLALEIQTHEGSSIQGIWVQGGNAGSIADGTINGDVLSFRLIFPGEDPVFTGGLTRENRLAGELTAVPLGGPAVFLRTSYDP